MAILVTTARRDLDADVTTIGVAGELNLDTAATMRATLLRCLSEFPTAIVVDLVRCRVAAPRALALFATAVAGQRDLGPPVLIVLCVARGDLPGLRRRRGALRGVPIVGDPASAAAMAAASSGRYRRFRLELPHSRQAPGRPATPSGSRANAGACRTCGLWPFWWSRSW